MAKMSDIQLGVIVKSEERAALDYEGELAKKRAMLMDYYNRQPYGDEVAGQSQAVTSDVADVVEWMLPSLVRMFTQGRLIAEFNSANADHDEESEQKTHLSNHCFSVENNGVLTLHNMFKDALLQYTGTVKIYWDETEEVSTTRYEGLSELEYQALLSDPKAEVKDVEYYSGAMGERLYDASSVKVTSSGKVKYDNIPPEEFLIDKTARNFDNPRFCGHRSPKTRSDLIEMGFDSKIVEALPADDYYEASEQKNARYHDYSQADSPNPANHSPNDILYLGEYYLEVDMDDDGITEYWKIFFAGDKVLEKEQVESHPFATCVPVPIPHRAIGSCPAEQTADIQFRKSVLVRQMLDNVYLGNYPRIAHSNKVDLDDLLTPRAGGSVLIDTNAPDVAGHVSPVVVPNMTDGVLRAIEYTDSEREVRTGITRYSQGLDAEALNKTATGFKGIREDSQQRLELVARLFADGGIKQIFIKTVELLGKHQDEAMQIRVLGEPMEINPRQWSANVNCRVNVGLGTGDRNEKIINLNNILAIQERFVASGLQLADQTGMYNTLEKLIDEVGLKEADMYFNDPQQPTQVLAAQNFQLQQMVMQLQQQVQQNPLAEAELIKAQAKMAEVQGKESNSMRQFMLKFAQDNQQFHEDLRLEYAKLAQNGDQFATQMLMDLEKSKNQL